jgi:integrase
MTRQVDRLDRADIDRATLPGMYPDGNGLYLVVARGGSKSWVLRYRAGDRRRDMGLGSYPLFGIKDARKRASIQRRLLADGVDPLAARAKKEVPRVGITFAQVADLTISAKRSAWTPRHENDWRQSLRDHAFPKLGDLPIAAIDTDMVEAVLRPIWAVKPVTAKRLRGRIETILDFATAKKYRSGDNPARWTGNLEPLLAADARGEQAHHAALPYADAAGFMEELRRVDSRIARALEFTILTAARTGEIRKAAWSEFDLGARTWTVPAGHMKGRREHRVPLSDAALTLLTALPKDGAGPFPIGERGMYRVSRKLRPEIAVHGFRSTFRDWAYETQTFPREIVEHCLAHIDGSQSEKAYRRGDALAKRAEVMAAWANHCAPLW